MLDGERRALFTNPLDSWLKEKGNADRLKPYISPGRCTASWRGYSGRWEIRGDKLVLLGLNGSPCSQNPRVIPLSELFPGQPEPVVASWYSGSLTIPDGRQTQYVHMGYMSRYERYILLQIERGQVVSRRVVGGSSALLPNPFPRSNDPPPPRIAP